MIGLNIKKLNILFVSAIVCLSACNDNSSEEISDEYVRKMDFLPVSLATRSPGDGDEYQGVSPYEDDILDDAFVAGESVLYISQLARGMTPFSYLETLGDDDDTDDGDGDSSDPSDGSGQDSGDDTNDDDEVNLTNVYKYTYEERDKYPNPNWETEFNFFPQKAIDMVDWEVIRSNGSYGNGFTLFGLYFPHSQKLRYEVESDQSTLENLQVSNVLGAYHSTSSLYTRLRFRLFHLMVYLKVNVFIPVFQTNVDDLGNSSISGFAADALQNVELMNVYPKFSINWTADRSSDTEAPLTEIVSLDETPVNINMYRHPFPNDGTLPQKIQIPISSYDPNVQDPEQTDEVWLYTYSVLFPAQGARFSESNFLRFNVRSNVGNVIKKYSFNGSQFAGTGQLDMAQGNMQTLNLYLPRNAGEAVLVKADVINWNFTSSDMHVSEDKNGTIED